MKILLAVDGSPPSEAAVDELCSRPWPDGTEVRVVTATVSLPPSFPVAPKGVIDGFAERERVQAAALVAQTQARIRERADELATSTGLLEGPPARAIVEEAERWGADLIVLGSQGLGAIKRFFLGSVSHAAALYAPCSVRIVRRS